LNVPQAQAGETFEFSLIDNAGGRFQLVGAQVLVNSGANLDFEDSSEHDIRIRMRDHSGNTFTETLRVNVTNLNEPPVLAALNDLTVTELQLLTVNLSAKDSDVFGGVPDSVSFSIAAGQQTGMSLDPTTGVFRWTPTDLQAGQYDVQFRATDNHNASHDRFVTIEVQESNLAPTNVALGNAMLDENVVAGIIGNLVVTDPNSQQTHSFAVSDPRFEVVDGRLKLRAGIVLDFEAAPRVQLEITAIDSGSPPESITRAFEIVVHNLNDQPTTIRLSKNIAVENLSGLTVGTLAADDQDEDQTHTFLVADTRFEIMNNELKLKDDQSFDLDQGAVVRVDVSVSDSGTPPQTFVQTLDINIAANPNPWRHEPLPFDVNADGQVVPLDILRVINQLNIPTILELGGKLPRSRPARSTLPFYDVNGDGFCTSNDVLQIINFLNEQTGEGESALPIAGEPIDAESAIVFLAYAREAAGEDNSRMDVQSVGEDDSLPATPIFVRPSLALAKPRLPSLAKKISATSEELDAILDEIAGDVSRAHGSQ
jgi:hypothetical protein